MSMSVQTGWYGQRLAATHNLDAAPTLILKESRKASVAVTRLRSGTGLKEASTPLPADKALTVHLQLRALPDTEVWIDQRRVYAEPYQKALSPSSTFNDRRLPACLARSAPLTSMR